MRWSSVLKAQGALKRLDQTFYLGARMALGIDRFAPRNVALVLENIIPDGLQNLRRLCQFMVRNRSYDLIDWGKCLGIAMCHHFATFRLGVHYL